MNRQALVAAIALTMSSGAMALEAVQDDVLSDVSGQAGLDITITPPTGGISLGIALHDTDGITTNSSAWSNSGAIVIGKVGTTTSTVTTGTNLSIANTAGFLMKVDAGGKGDADKAMLQVAVSSTGSTTIHTGDLSVAKSGASSTGVIATSKSNTILSDMTITLGAGNLMTMQLGNEEQTNVQAGTTQMIRLNSSMASGLTISNFSLADTSAGGGSLAATSIDVKNCGSASCATVGSALDLDVGVNITSTGLVLTVGDLASGNGIGSNTFGGAYVKMTGLSLGSATVVGNVEVYGLQLAGTQIKVAGH